MKKSLFSTLVALLMASSPAFALETVDGAQKDLEAFKSTMSVKLQAVNQKIDELRMKAAAKQDEMAKKTADDYDRLRTDLVQEVNRLEADAKGDWKATKNRLARSVDDLNSKIQHSIKE